MSEDTPSLTTQEEIMFFDTDAGGVVHNIAYLRFIETCRTRLAMQLGMDLQRMMAEQQFPVVVRTEIDYLRPARFGDTLEIRGILTEIGRARFWFSFEIHRLADGTKLITCRQALALVEMPRGRPLRIPSEWRIRWPHLARGAE